MLTSQPEPSTSIPHDLTVAQRLKAMAHAGSMAIYVDIDGTLSPIAPTPDSARLAPGARDVLERCLAAGIRVVAITGRSAEDARELVGLNSILYAGNHGFELLTPTVRIVREDVRAAAALISAALADVNEKLPGLPAGILVENKTYTGSVHYRLTDNHAEAIAILRPLLIDRTEHYGLDLTEGRLVFEIRPRLHINKGVFVAHDVVDNNIKVAAVFGDDVTDADAFRSVHQLLDKSVLGDAFAVAVVSAETPVEVIRAADQTVASVSDLVSELQIFVASLVPGGVQP